MNTVLIRADISVWIVLASESSFSRKWSAAPMNVFVLKIIFNFLNRACQWSSCSPLKWSITSIVTCKTFSRNIRNPQKVATATFLVSLATFSIQMAISSKVAFGHSDTSRQQISILSILRILQSLDLLPRTNFEFLCRETDSIQGHENMSREYPGFLRFWTFLRVLRCVRDVAEKLSETRKKSPTKKCPDSVRDTKKCRVCRFVRVSSSFHTVYVMLLKSCQGHEEVSR